MNRALAFVAVLVAGLLVLATGTAEGGGTCMPSDVRDTCCPAGCAAKAGRNWAKADDVLRACMRAIGCSGGGTDSATVFLMCECGAK